MLKDNRIRVIVGHYGSGKTEFSVNYAIKLSKEVEKVAIADLDVVNPYFRSREKSGKLEEMGIKVIASNVKGLGSDLPAVSPAIVAPLQDKSYEAVFDVGGDHVGARALGRYKESFEEGDYDMLFVINANRPETQTAERVIAFIEAIEANSRIKVTGLINNTHLLKSTTVEDILKGQELVKEVSQKTGLPIKYVAGLRDVVEKLPEDIEGEIFPIDLYMREDWMS